MASKPGPKDTKSETHNVADEKAKKEELVEAKMRMIRKKNEELIRRQKEIEEDRRNADKYSEMAVKKHPENFVPGVNKESSTPGRGRGRGRGLMLQEMRKETLKAKQWEAKRRENVQKEEEERKTRGTTSGPANRFLADDDRVDMSRTTGRNEHSWGGASFNKVVNRMHREKEGFRPGRQKGNIEMTMSGKERHEYSQWREERAKIDKDRMARQKKSGNWSRAWDQRKTWDPRRKMWVYENDDGDHSFKSTRRWGRDDSEDWGGDNRNSRRDYGDRDSEKQGSRFGGFGQHDDREMEAREKWGETSESRVVQHEEEWGETTESRVVQHEAEWGKTGESRVAQHQGGSGETSEGRVMKHEEDWGEASESSVVQHKADESKGMTLDHQQDVASSTPCHDEHVEENGSSYSDVPKPQRETKQRRKQNDSVENDKVKTNKESASTVEETYKPPSHKKDFDESVANRQESNVIEKDQDKHFESPAVSISESELPNSKEKNGEQSLTTNSGTVADSLKASEHAINNEQDTGSSGIHNVREQTNGGEGTEKHKLAAHKANLPKLDTKVEKKVTFDSKNEDVKERNSQDDTSVTIGDIPPTPDFLKFDHSLEWGDIEVEEETDVVEPKW